MLLFSAAILATMVSGTVQSGSGPIAGASVTVYGAATAISRPLGTTRSARDGTFRVNVPAQANDVVYAIATGGTSAKHTRPNPAIALMAIVPQRTSGSLVINELSTVASGYALAQFLRGTALSGASPGLPNAAATTFNLVSPGGGVSPVLASPPNGVATEALSTFESLAAIVSACVDGAPPACSALFAAARPPGGAAPANTLEAVVDIARNPVHDAAAIFRLLPAMPAYLPVLTSAPNAWVLALKYTAGGFDAPGRIAFDTAGNVWSTNNFEPPTTTVGLGLTVLSPTGRPILNSPLKGGGVYGAGFGIAIDSRNRVWIGNVSGSSISLFSNDGVPLSRSEASTPSATMSPSRASTPSATSSPGMHGGWTNGEISAPQGLAIDLRGNVWIPNSGILGGSSSVTEYVGGDPALARVFATRGILSPFCIAVDAANDIWVANGGTAGSVAVLRNDSTPMPYSPITDPKMKSLKGLALDSAGNAWTAGFGSRNVFEIASNGTIAPVSPITAPSMRGPWGVAVDGDDNVWVADFTGMNVIELCGRNTAHCPPGLKTGATLSPSSSGFTSAGLQHLTAVQIDPSGNVWVTNNVQTPGSNGARYAGGDGLVEFVGLAAPVKTPLIGLPRRP
jgi:hypothetical protein